MQKTKKMAVGSSMLTACILGVLIAFVAVILLVLISAICISSEYFSVNTIQYMAIIIQFTGVFIGSLLAGKMTADKKVAACAITACGFVAFQLCSALLFFDGISAKVIAGTITAGIAALCAIYLCAKNKKPPSARKRRNRYR